MKVLRCCEFIYLFILLLLHLQPLCLAGGGAPGGDLFTGEFRLHPVANAFAKTPNVMYSTDKNVTFSIA